MRKLSNSQGGLRWIAAMMLLAALATAARAEVQYTILDLGSLETPIPNPFGPGWIAGINNSGQVAGTVFCPAAGAPRAFRTTPNMPINLATDNLGSIGANSAARGINNLGQVVGWSDDFPGPPHAFRTAANQPINPATDDLGLLGGGTGSMGFAINSSGQVAGEGDINNSPEHHAFRTAANQPINPATDDLGTLGGPYCQGRGINDSGQVAGCGFMGIQGIRGFRVPAGRPINPATDDLGTLGGNQTQAFAINNAGQVVGMSCIDANETWHAFRTLGNGPINPASDDLGTLGGAYSRAMGINNLGQAVGASAYTPDPNVSIHAFLYSNGVMKDLNSLIPSGSGWELSEAIGINDSGQIVGHGGFNGGLHGFLLTPVPPSAPVVDAGTDRAIRLPATGSLSGTVSDDGLPDPPGATTVTWSKMSGPVAVTFRNAHAAATVATFSTAGTYVLRLSASDSAMSGYDECQITVLPAYPNGPPQVNAGADRPLMLIGAIGPHVTATLAGSVSDDGLPNPPAAVSTTWTRLSGPALVTFADANARTTAATFTAAGTYVLRLTASDSVLSGTDDLRVTVRVAGDFTGDGRVDGLDFLNWQAHYPNFIGGATADGGDGNGDGLVDGRDFLVWQANYRP